MAADTQTIPLGVTANHDREPDIIFVPMVGNLIFNLKIKSIISIERVISAF